MSETTILTGAKRSYTFALPTTLPSDTVKQDASALYTPLKGRPKATNGPSFVVGSLRLKREFPTPTPRRLLPYPGLTPKNKAYLYSRKSKAQRLKELTDAAMCDESIADVDTVATDAPTTCLIKSSAYGTWVSYQTHHRTLLRRKRDVPVRRWVYNLKWEGKTSRGIVDNDDDTCQDGCDPSESEKDSAEQEEESIEVSNSEDEHLQDSDCTLSPLSLTCSEEEEVLLGYKCIETSPPEWDGFSPVDYVGVEGAGANVYEFC